MPLGQRFEGMSVDTSSDENNRVDSTRIGSEIDRECDRFEAYWRSGERPRIEDFVSSATNSTRTALLRCLLAVELDYRCACEDFPEPEEYHARFPGQERVINSAFADRAARLKLAGGAASETLELELGQDETRTDSAPAQAPEPYPRIPGCEILSELGRGGMGVVYKARQIRLNRLCALKIALPGRHPGPDGRTRFLAEAETIAKLRHANIVQIYNLGEHDGRPYFEMEYIEGSSLARRLDGTPWAPAAAARMVSTLAHAAGEAHRLGIVHRDLKPGNVLVLDDGTPKIVDFGLAKSLESDSQLTQSGVFIGTPSYAAPEQVAGLPSAVGPAADIYAMGSILYHLLTGRPPFHAPTALETLEQVKSAEAVPPSRLQPGLPRDIETIALKCLEKEPQRRYSDASAMAEDLERFLAGRPILARPTGAVERMRKSIRRRPAVSFLSAAVLAVTVLGFVLVAAQWRRADLKAAAATAANERAQRARLDAFREQAELTEYKALALCDHGEVVRGLSWLARSLVLAEEAGAHGFVRPIRINVADWEGQLLRSVSIPPIRHGAPIVGLAFRHGGKSLVSVGADGAVRFWDPISGQETQTPLELSANPAIGRLERARFGQSASGLLAVIDDQGQAAIWDLDQKCHMPLEPGESIRDIAFADDDDDSSVEAIAHSPLGRKVITGNQAGRLHVWDAEKQRGFDLPPQGTEITSLAVTPDGRIFASGTEGGVVRLWDASFFGQFGQTFKLTGGVAALTFDPTSRFLAIGEDDGTIKLWELPRQKALGPPIHVGAPVQTLTYFGEGRRLLIGTTEGARSYDLDRASAASRGGCRGDRHGRHLVRVDAATISPDRRFMATAKRVTIGRQVVGRIELRDAATGKALRQTPDQLEPLVGMVFSPDSRFLLTWGPKPRTARLWDVASLRDSRPVCQSLECSIRQAEFSRDGRRLMLGCRDGAARLWDLDSDGEVYSQHRVRHAYPITAVAFDAQRSRLVTGCHAGTVRLWDWPGGTMVNEMRQNAGEIVVLAFSPDRTMVLSASHDGTARFLDAESGRQLGPSLQHTDAVLCVAFHPGGRSVVTGTRDGIVQRWSVPLPAASDKSTEILRRFNDLINPAQTQEQARDDRSARQICAD
jgi:eukaryotic-like serine/threonine-protein kinase